ncbi:MAG: sporulation transcription factor Spo0A [Syntrophomonadaceae bacterium]|nr:sporulation transcription factor Spo0A [Syntrophomonadaceae bacterium]
MERIIEVLIADDNVEFGAVMEQFFAGTPDLRVVGRCANGLETLEALETTRADVLVLDLVMPFVDGIGVLEKLRQRKSEDRPRVVVLTAFGHENMTRKALQLGADYYMVKPFSLTMLAERIRQVVVAGHGPVLPAAGEEPNVEHETSRLLQQLGVPAHVKGYVYLRDAVVQVARNGFLVGKVTKELYPAIAREYGTTPARVERAMRHAVELAWLRADEDFMNGLFGHSLQQERAKPTNSEFIAVLADRVRMCLGLH